MTTDSDKLEQQTKITGILYDLTGSTPATNLAVSLAYKKLLAIIEAAQREARIEENEFWITLSGGSGKVTVNSFHERIGSLKAAQLTDTTGNQSSKTQPD